MNTSQETENPSEDTQYGGSQVVALNLNNELYGVDIALVHTVVALHPITRVPRTPSYILGVMNLRGRVLPVIDLRTRFGLPSLPEEARSESRIVIVDVDGVSSGLVVDSVSEVLRLSAGSLQPPPSLVDAGENRFVSGIGAVPRASGAAEAGTRMILLLDVEKLIAAATEDARTQTDTRTPARRVRAAA